MIQQRKKSRNFSKIHSSQNEDSNPKTLILIFRKRLKPQCHPKALDSRHSIDSCTYQLHGWRPFQLQQTTPAKTLDSSDPSNHRPYYSSNGLYTKCPCLSDRTTSYFIDAIDFSRLSLIDDDRSISADHHNRGSFCLLAKKRTQSGWRSMSGQSSDWSGTQWCCSVGASAAYGTCSDFPMAVGTDSSGELFGNGDVNWLSDVIEAWNSRREKDGGSGEKESVAWVRSNGGFSC